MRSPSGGLSAANTQVLFVSSDEVALLCALTECLLDTYYVPDALTIPTFVTLSPSLLKSR